MRNAAATAIQSCFRGYRDFIRHLMTTFSIIQIQTRVRTYQAKCQLLILKQEKHEEERKLLLNAAATAIQTSFRGYRDFVRFVIISFFIIKIQAIARGYQARCCLKRLVREERERKIQRSRRLSNTASKHIKKKRQSAADDVPPKTIPLESNQNKGISAGKELQKQQEKKAALVIERFFIKIKAEIDIEISRLERKKAVRKPQEEKQLVDAKQSSNRKDDPPSISSVYSFSGSRRHKETNNASHTGGRPRKSVSSAEMTPSQKRREQSSSQARQQAKGMTPSAQDQHFTQTTGHGASKSRPFQNNTRNASPPTERMPSTQASIRKVITPRGQMPPIQSFSARKQMPSIQSAGAMMHAPQARERMPSMQSFSAMRNASPARKQIPSMESATDMRNASTSKGPALSVQSPSPPMRNASPSRERMSSVQSVSAVRNASPAKERMSSIQPGSDMRYASPSRERMPSITSGSAMASPSREQMHSIQSASPLNNQGYNAAQQVMKQHHAMTPRENMIRNPSPPRGRMPQRQNAIRNASPSRERLPQRENAMRNASPLRERTPQRDNAMRNASPSRDRAPSVQHSGYQPAPTFNQTPRNPPHPNGYPPFNHNMSHQQTPQGTYNLQSSSFSSSSHYAAPNYAHQLSQRNNPPSTSSRQSASNSVQNQIFNPPLTSSSGHHPQVKLHNPPLTNSQHSAMTPVRGHYAEHQRGPALSQTPNSQYSATTPVRSHHAEHQRGPAQSQTPVQSQQYNNIQSYQKSYNRY